MGFIGPKVAFCFLLVFMLAAWAFFVFVFLSDPLALSDSLARWVHDNPTITTIIVSGIASVISFFSVVVKWALRKRITRQPISLYRLSAGAASAGTSFWFNSRHCWLSFAILFVFVAFCFLTSVWTTLLTPVSVMLSLQMGGSELDIGSSNFDASLQQALAAPVSSVSWIEVFGSNSLMSGIAAAGNVFGLENIFNFNNVRYNATTGGILPAIAPYDGTQQLAPLENSGINFSGGYVPGNLTASPDHSGISSTYTVLQQGLTANVTCVEYTSAAEWGGLQVEQTSVSGDLGSVPFTLWALEAICPENGGESSQGFVTNPLVDSVGLLASVVCPNVGNVANASLNYTFNQILVISNGTGMYNFLPPTVCEIIPVITQSIVTYADHIISATVVDSTPIEPWQQNLLLFLVSVINYQAWSTQGVKTNTLGDALISIYTATTTSSITDSNTTQILQELSQFWRGVVEFSGTYIRSGFSAYPRTAPSDMLVGMSGTQNVTTVGWTVTWQPTYLYTLFPVTSTAFLAIGAFIYNCIDRKKHAKEVQNHDTSDKTDVESGVRASDLNERRVASADFDATDPIHLVVASAEPGQLSPGSAPAAGFWEKYETSEVLLQEAKLRNPDRGRDSGAIVR
ncbi:hypothetical protein HYDPIDRAFT_44239 [Hydnomerulius pinastri MD-312]|uniref:Transmembrane protein n=1 Tax=Hydnomerulius pinastri MD-312 TaxID=994086 RepID=A0A0C9VZM5_9AGAM|nr:hypothetical protein HYDPIDRAFT_44239 [Hydnomerulius pinastri MD-312]